MPSVSPEAHVVPGVCLIPTAVDGEEGVLGPDSQIHEPEVVVVELMVDKS